MFETLEQPRPPTAEKEKDERVKEIIRDFLLGAVCSMRNAIADLEGEIERLSFGPDAAEKDEAAIKACQLTRGLIEEGLQLMESRGKEMGVMLS